MNQLGVGSGREGAHSQKKGLQVVVLPLDRLLFFFLLLLVLLVLLVLVFAVFLCGFFLSALALSLLCAGWQQTALGDLQNKPQLRY